LRIGALGLLMSNCSTFKILIDRFAGQRLSVTVDCSWARRVRKRGHVGEFFTQRS
jgi:hypothetical protein